ncbi:hypothetical protein NPIL_91421 [Nephila pilipes]|uniref:Uncharacterized protein n=1 Tax=Nephila pilipes TaxID=299642 RepID=A0A8X6NX62_NEPPI|nr:hypothetical protein NPIL_91421 [Nephila pilipes]
MRHRRRFLDFLYVGCVVRFGVSMTVTTDRGRILKVSCFTPLPNILEFTKHLKAALRCHDSHKWLESIAIVLLRIRTSLKVDLEASLTEFVYSQL